MPLYSQPRQSQRTKAMMHVMTDIMHQIPKFPAILLPCALNSNIYNPLAKPDPGYSDKKVWHSFLQTWKANKRSHLPRSYHNPLAPSTQTVFASELATEKISGTITLKSLRLCRNGSHPLLWCKGHTIPAPTTDITHRGVTHHWSGTSWAARMCRAFAYSLDQTNKPANKIN